MKMSLVLAAVTSLLLLSACMTGDTIGLVPDAGPIGTKLRPDRFAGEPDATMGAPDAPWMIGGDGPFACGGTTGNLCEDGAPCAFSGDCQVGSICNIAGDPYYDPEWVENVCIRLVCTRDDQCRPDQVCSAERVCATRGCQTAFDCSSGFICSGGACKAQPVAIAASCEVLTPDTVISRGRSVRLEARVVDGAGRVVGGLALDWSSSAPARVAVVGDLATGGAEAGIAEVTARLNNTGTTTSCSGRVRIENVIAPVAASVQVRVVAAESGAPLDARVIVFAGGVQTEQSTGPTGLTVFPAPAGAVQWVTVLSVGREIVTVMTPGTRDLYIPLERAPTPQRAGGFRGVVDLAAAPRGDFYVGLAGAALPLDLSKFRLSMLLGDIISTDINAPQLGLSGQRMDLPGNLMMRLGNERFTVDRETTDLRCQGVDPGATELGCYVARAPAGPTVGWTLSTRLRLQDVAPLAGRISGMLGEGFDIIAVLPEVLPLMRTAASGVNAAINTAEVLRVDAATGLPLVLCANPSTAPDDARCRADFARYAPTTLRANAPRVVHSAVAVPRLPTAGGQEPEGVVVMAAARTPHGLVPLGLAAARDDPGAPDGLVEPTDRPFGPFSETLPAGEIPLSSAVAHSGLEGSPLQLIAVVYDRATKSGTGSRISGLVDHPTRLTQSMAFSRGFLGYASGVLDRSSGSFVGTVPAGAMTLRIELIRGAHAWRIYAPPTTTTLTVPDVLEARADLLSGSALPEVSLQALRARGSTAYTDLFTAGSGVDLHSIHTVTEAFSAQRCATDTTALCRVR